MRLLAHLLGVSGVVFPYWGAVVALAQGTDPIRWGLYDDSDSVPQLGEAVPFVLICLLALAIYLVPFVMSLRRGTRGWQVGAAVMGVIVGVLVVLLARYEAARHRCVTDVYRRGRGADRVCSAASVVQLRWTIAVLIPVILAVGGLLLTLPPRRTPTTEGDTSSAG